MLRQKYSLQKITWRHVKYFSLIHSFDIFYFRFRKHSAGLILNFKKPAKGSSMTKTYYGALQNIASSKFSFPNWKIMKLRRNRFRKSLLGQFKNDRRIPCKVSGLERFGHEKNNQYVNDFP